MESAVSTTQTQPQPQPAMPESTQYREDEQRKVTAYDIALFIVFSPFFLVIGVGDVIVSSYRKLRNHITK